MDIGFVVLESILALAIITINLLVCVTIYLHKELRCVTNYLIVSLAVADLGVGALAIPFSMVLSMEYTLYFYTCLFLTCFPLVTTQFSILLLLVIAIHTHLKIKLPNSYPLRVKKHWVMFVVGFCWLLSLLIGFSPMMGWNKVQQYGGTRNKSKGISFQRAVFIFVIRDKPPKDLISQAYGDPGYSHGLVEHLDRCSFTSIFSPEFLVYFIFLICTLLPLTAMLGIYADIFRVVRDHFRSQPLWPAKRKEVQMACTLLLLVGVFFVCWMPLHTIYCVQLLCPSCDQYASLEHLAVLLSHLNSLANPLVYALRKKNLGLALRSVFLYRVLRWPSVKACCGPSPKIHPQAEFGRAPDASPGSTSLSAALLYLLAVALMLMPIDASSELANEDERVAFL
ncbi:adenosine receptor A1-like [Erythrolamprus reginae]|uniref:adenosine receptor A1-like n=1 Tax=Erythrolamprus reginae TaxID=121349 RepID=UPI00396CC383